jgi:hypothetical protein
MKLLIYAEGLRGASRFKVLLNFCHVVSSLDLASAQDLRGGQSSPSLAY